MGDGPALGRMLAFGLDGEQVVTEHIEFAFGKSLMVQLTAFGRRCDGIEHPYFSYARFSVVRNQLVPVGGHPYARKWNFSLQNKTPFPRDQILRQSFVFRGSRESFAYLQHFPGVCQRFAPRLQHAQEAVVFQVMFIVSYPLIVRRAVLKLKMPRPGLTRRFMNR